MNAEPNFHAVPLRRATIYRMVMGDHVCPFGLKAKAQLEKHGYQVDDRWLRTREEVDAFKAQHGVKTTPQVWIGEDRIGGHDALRAFLGDPVAGKNDTTYAPVVAIFAVAALSALAARWATDTLTFASWLQWAIAFAMVLLGLQKLQDVESFTTGFLGYDLLARKWVGYAYIYPFAETAAGLLMITGVLLWVSVPVALFIGVVGVVSVVQAVYVEKRELRCACVGGNSRVPLGFVSLLESALMVFMALWMLAMV